MTRLLLLSLVVVAAPLARAADLRPFPQHVAYASGTIRPSHQTQAQQDAAVRTYYDQWKADFLTTDGTGNPSHWRVRFLRRRCMWSRARITPGSFARPRPSVAFGRYVAARCHDRVGGSLA